MKKKILYTEFAESNGISFEDIYQRRLNGESWQSLANGKVFHGTLRNMTQEWCRDNHRNFDVLLKNGAGTITDVDCVDDGRVKALRKAHWSIKDIAEDCHCTEECVREILHEL